MEKVSRTRAEKQKFYSIAVLKPNKKYLIDKSALILQRVFQRTLILGFSVQGMASNECLHTHTSIIIL